VISSLLRTPRPVPGRLVPASAGAAVIGLALPVYAIGGWRLAGWGLAAALWVASELFGLLLARLPLSASNLARAGMVAFGMMFRAIAVMVILVAVAVSDARLAASAAVLFALAYTLELGLSLITYFAGESR
jgi:hypothetical protein